MIFSKVMAKKNRCHNICYTDSFPFATESPEPQISKTTHKNVSSMLPTRTVSHSREEVLHSFKNVISALQEEISL